MVEREDLTTTLKNTLGHCQIKVKVTFSPWKDKTPRNLTNKTSQNIVNMMYHNEMVVLTEMAITHLGEKKSLKEFLLVGYCENAFAKQHEFLEIRSPCSLNNTSYSEITGRKNGKENHYAIAFYKQPPPPFFFFLVVS